MSRPDGPLLVLGVGNVLLGDEGIGVRIMGELGRRASAGQISLPAGTRLVDGGTLGLDLLPLIEDARAILFVDAVDLGRAPGTVAVIEGRALATVLAGHLSAHQVGLADLLAVGRLLGTLPDAVALIGVQPGEVSVGLEQTPAVKAAVEAAVLACIRELELLAVSATSATGSVAPGPAARADPGLAAAEGEARLGPVPDRSVPTAPTG